MTLKIWLQLHHIKTMFSKLVDQPVIRLQPQLVNRMTKSSNSLVPRYHYLKSMSLEPLHFRHQSLRLSSLPGLLALAEKKSASMSLQRSLGRRNLRKMQKMMRAVKVVKIVRALVAKMK